jgi:hypothetical protein
VVCSTHGKVRSRRNLVDDGYGGLCCGWYPKHACLVGRDAPRAGWAGEEIHPSSDEITGDLAVAAACQFHAHPAGQTVREAILARLAANGVEVEPAGSPGWWRAPPDRWGRIPSLEAVLAAVPLADRAVLGSGAGAAATATDSAPGADPTDDASSAGAAYAGVPAPAPAAPTLAPGQQGSGPAPERDTLIHDLFHAVAGPDRTIASGGLEQLARTVGFPGDWPAVFQSITRKFAGGGPLLDFEAFSRFMASQDYVTWTIQELTRCLRLLQALPLGGLVPTPAREAACLALFRALDRDADGRLSQAELFTLATTLALRGPDWPVPEDSASHTAAGWGRVYRDWCQHYGGPSSAFDLTAMSRALSASPRDKVGGFRLTTADIASLAVFLAADDGPVAAAGAPDAAAPAPAAVPAPPASPRGPATIRPSVVLTPPDGPAAAGSASPGAAPPAEAAAPDPAPASLPAGAGLAGSPGREAGGAGLAPLHGLAPPAHAEVAGPAPPAGAAGTPQASAPPAASVPAATGEQLAAALAFAALAAAAADHDAAEGAEASDRALKEMCRTAGLAALVAEQAAEAAAQASAAASAAAAAASDAAALAAAASTTAAAAAAAATAAETLQVEARRLSWDLGRMSQEATAARQKAAGLAVLASAARGDLAAATARASGPAPPPPAVSTSGGQPAPTAASTGPLPEAPARAPGPWAGGFVCGA